MYQANNPNASVSTERLLSTNPRKVFAAFGQPDRLAQWWGPSGFTNTFEQFEFKPGGRWVFVMHGPNGANYPNESVFREIQPDTKIVIEHVVKPWYRLTVTLTIRPLLRIGLVPTGLRIPLAYGGDVAEAIVACLEKDETIGDVYTLAGPDRSAREFANAWRAAGGRIARFAIPIPIPIRFSYDTTRAVTRLNWRHKPFLDAPEETFAIEAAAQRDDAAGGTTRRS